MRDLSAKTKREVARLRRRSGARVVGEASAIPMVVIVGKFPAEGCSVFKTEQGR